MSAQTFTDIIKFNKDTTQGLSVKNAESTQQFHIYKADDDKRLIFGWGSVAIRTDGEQVVDLQNDLIDPEDLEEAVYEYVLDFRDGGEEHIPKLRKKARLVESVVFTKEKMKAMGIPEGTVPEGWWLGFYIDDDEAWKKVKNGTYQMFSIEGQGIREEVKEPLAKNAYDMWLEENLDEFEDDKDERDFANWKSEYGIPQKATDVDVIDMMYSEYRKIDKADRINGCGIIVLNGNKILTATRIGGKHGNQICGPGGHIEAGESHEEAAIRETYEEFGIDCQELEPLGILDGGRNYGKSAVFLCTEYKGEPHTDEEEMTDLKWRTIDELREEKLFWPFEQSLDLIEEMSPEKRHAVAKTFDEILKFNPYHDAKGRFSTSNGYASFTTRTKDPKKQHWADKAVQRLKQQAPAAPATPPKPKVNRDRLGFADHDDADYHQLGNRKNYYQQQQLTPKQKTSVSNYLEAHTEPGSLYSHSQNLNMQMATGQTLKGKYKQTYDGLMSSMHNIGINAKLTRYDHPDAINAMLKTLGAGTDYSKMNVTTLKKALVGKSFKENKFISCSTNDFQNAPVKSKNVFTNRAVKVVYKAKADVQAMMPGHGAGGDLGEMILAPTNGTTNRGGTITGVRFTGQKARRKGTQLYDMPQIEITVEI